jgi:hypothetical protein
MFCRGLAIVGSNEVLGVAEVVQGLPCGFPDRVAGPFDEVLAMLSGSSTIQESLYFVLEFVIDENWFRRSVVR